MSRVLAETDLPAELSPFEAVDAAYPAEITRIYEALRRRLPVLIECEKELSPFLYRSIRERLKVDGTRCLYLDGRAAQDLPPPPPGTNLVGAMIHQIREGNDSVVGLMIESNIVAGNQPIPADLSQMKYGCSVTDACVGWETTEEMLRNAAAVLREAKGTQERVA